MNIFKRHEISGGSSFAVVTVCVGGEARSVTEGCTLGESFDSLPTANNLHWPSQETYRLISQSSAGTFVHIM